MRSHRLARAIKPRPPRAAGARKPRAPLVLGLLAAAAGLAVLATAVHPGWHGLLALAVGAIDPFGLAIAKGLIVADAVGLLLIARSLTRGSRRAWRAALALLAASFGLQLLHDVELPQALVSLTLLGAFWHWRWSFTGRGDPGGPRRAAIFAGTGLGVVYVVAVATVAVHAVLRDQAATIGGSLRQAAAALVGIDAGHPSTRFSSDLSTTFATAAAALVAAALYFALRAPRSGARQTADQRRIVNELVQSSRPDTLAYFALRHDKAYFVAASGRAALAYRALSGIALVSGDPIGDPAAIDDLLDQFAAHCRARAWRIAVIGVSADRRAAWQHIGLRAIYVGDEAVVDPARFTLDGRVMRKVRQSVTRLQRAGFRTRVVRARDMTEDDWRAIDEVSRAYEPDKPVQGFSMAADDFRTPEFADAVFVIGDDAGGAAGYLHFVPVPASTGLSLSAMRRVPDTPNGFTEFLLAETFAWSREHGVSLVSLNFNAFGRLLRGEYEPRLRHHLARWGVHQLERVAQVERLHDFNRKFLPDWQPRYFACESLADLPAAVLVLLGLERLIYPPRAARRLWASARAAASRSGARHARDPREAQAGEDPTRGA
jgi:lysyl-tRNA synthetase, class II